MVIQVSLYSIYSTLPYVNKLNNYAPLQASWAAPVFLQMRQQSLLQRMQDLIPIGTV